MESSYLCIQNLNEMSSKFDICQRNPTLQPTLNNFIICTNFSFHTQLLNNFSPN